MQFSMENNKTRILWKKNDSIMENTSGISTEKEQNISLKQKIKIKNFQVFKLVHPNCIFFFFKYSLKNYTKIK